MSKLSFRARALDASKPMPIYLAEELPDLPDYSAINRAVPQMPSGMEKEEESEHHLQRAISGTGLIIPTPEVHEVGDLVFYDRCYPADYKMPKQHIHMQPLWEEQETPEYDIDSEDERWLKQQHHPELTELLFEQMMDKLERCSGQTVVTLGEAKLLLERADDLVIAVYDYWLNKRLSTQHALILSVKTENRPGQSTNNPYLAFRRRTEKMQTRKNRKNDESSYEKMVKLRRELARALSLLRLVAKREQAKRDLVRLTGTVAVKRHIARDYSPQPVEPPRPVLPPLPSFRRELPTPPYTPRAPPAPEPRQREKRPYKRRKHRHHASSGVTPLRGDSGIYSSSEEENVNRVEPATPPDDGPFAFRRKPGCSYEMPTSTLYGDPVDESQPDVCQHEVDVRHRFTLVSLSEPYARCIGFARRRVGRGGRIILDRVRTPLDDLWPTLPAADTRQQRREEVEFETKAHRNPKEMVRDFHTSGKYPWRHAFRKHLAQNPSLWTADVKPDVGDFKLDMSDFKMDISDLKMDVDDLKPDINLNLNLNLISDLHLPQDSDISYRTHETTFSEINTNANDCGESERQIIDSAVKVNLDATLRERAYSPCSDTSCDSDSSLYPVEKEFEKFISEVNRKWPHYRPRTPPLRPETPPEAPLSPRAPISVELSEPSSGLGVFTTHPFTLDALPPSLGPLFDELDSQDNSFLWSSARPPSPLGSSRVRVVQDKEPLIVDRESPPPIPRTPAPPAPRPQPAPAPAPTPAPARPPHRAPPTHTRTVQPQPVIVTSTPPPLATVKVEASQPKEVKVDVKEEKIVATKPSTYVPPPPLLLQQQSQQIKIEKKRSQDTIEEVSLPHGVQLKTVHTKHSPLKKHIITAAAHRRDVHDPPQIVTVNVSQSLKVRLQNHLAGASSGAVINGPYATARDHAVVSTVSSAGPSPRRVSTPLVHLAPAPSAPTPPPATPAPPRAVHPPLVLASHAIHHVASNKLKVLHAHPLTHTQRSQLLNQSRGIPAVVSIAPLAETKSNAGILKGAPVTQLFEIKGGQLGKGPHLVNVVRPHAKTTVARLDLNDAKTRQVVATFDGTALKGAPAGGARAQRVSVSMDGRQLVRAGPQHIHLNNRTFQVQASPRTHEPSTSMSMAGVPQGTKTASIPSSVVANLLHQKQLLPKGGQKIAISGPAGQALAANVQAIALSAAQLKARQARLIRQPPPQRDIESIPSTSKAADNSNDDETGTNGVRRRGHDAMEVT